MKASLRLLTALAILGFMTACSHAPTAAPVSLELTARSERAVVKDLINDYYAQFRKDSGQDFTAFYTADGRLEVNGWIVNGHDEIKDMYIQAGIIGGNEEAPKAEGAVPAGAGETLSTSLDIDVQGDKAVAKMIWLTLRAERLTSAPEISEYGTEWTELAKQDGRWLIKNRIIRSGGGMPAGQMKNIQ